jgi:Cu/Ag efflux pump CusA
MTFRLHDLIPILQVAIGPVILVSGIGLLLLSMTNRFGRVTDRSRELAMERRARVIRRAITLAISSVLLAAVLIITLFVAAIFALEVGALVATLFIGCMAALIGALVAFLRDINLSLAALTLELEP